MNILMGIFVVGFLLYTIGASVFHIWVYQKDIRPFNVMPIRRKIMKVSNEEVEFSS